MAFRYTPEFFERAGTACTFPILPGSRRLSALAPWVVEARLWTPHALGSGRPGRVSARVGGAPYSAALGEGPAGSSLASAADERRISPPLFVSSKRTRVSTLPLELLASTSKMSEFHFVRVFKQVTSVTPHQYILRARLREAATRLKTGSEPVIEIALDTGFQDLSNFHHAFRAEFGVSPRAYRRQTRA